MGEGSQKVIGPQPGPQTKFLASAADIAIYGGAAGGGKSWALLMEPLRHIANPEFGAVFFRRSTVQVRNEGGLWDESQKLYPTAGGQPKEHVLTWSFPRPGSNSGEGASVSFAHLEHDKTVLNWQGSQIPLICFDELTHFSQKQFWYMVSRNRSMCGVRPYIRATCNPDADSWVAEFISWWIDPATGVAIPERSGVLRWFVRVNDKLIWADEPKDLAEHTAPNEHGALVPITPKSVTFIAAKLSDNAALMAADPGYLANLMALPTVERERLLGGNWKIRPAAGLFFREEDIKHWVERPKHLHIYGTSDYAVKADGGDWTVHRIWGVDQHGGIYRLAGWRGQTRSDEWIERKLDLIAHWKPLAWFGEAGVIKLAVEPMLLRRMRERRVYCRLEWLTSIQDKPTRARGIQARMAMGMVWFEPGADTSEFLAFPVGAHDDDVDNASLIGRALDEAHPAIAPVVTKPKPRDLWDHADDSDGDDWKTA